MPEGGIARLKQGWLIKQGGRVKNWKRRFFVLDGSRRFTYYVSEADARAGVNQLGIIDLQKALFVKPRGSQAKSSGSSNIAWPAQVSSDYCFLIITNDRNYGIYSDISTDDCRSWVTALQAIRGNVDSNEIMVEVSAAKGPGGGHDDQTDQYGATAFGGRSRANTLAAVNAYKTIPESYNLPPNLLPKVVVMYARWHQILLRTLADFADHFSMTSSFKFECNMSEVYAKAPKVLRNRLGELVFADYVDELRYNVIGLIGNEPVGKMAFVEATKKRIIRFQVGELVDEEVVRASPISGVIEITVPAKHIGKGIHLTGKRFLDGMIVGTDDSVCGGALKGLPLLHALNICKARECCSASLQRIVKLLSSQSALSFRCNYLSIYEKASGLHDVQKSLGDVVIRNLLVEAVSAVHTQVPPMKRMSFAACISSCRMIFELADDEEAKESATINHNGDLVLAAGLKKLQELAVYGRPAHFNLAPLVKLCAEESSM